MSDWSWSWLWSTMKWTFERIGYFEKVCFAKFAIATCGDNIKKKVRKRFTKLCAPFPLYFYVIMQSGILCHFCWNLEPQSEPRKNTNNCLSTRECTVNAYGACANPSTIDDGDCWWWRWWWWLLLQNPFFSVSFTHSHLSIHICRLIHSISWVFPKILVPNILTGTTFLSRVSVTAWGKKIVTRPNGLLTPSKDAAYAKA